MSNQALSIGSIVEVVAAPASIYSLMNGDLVEIISTSQVSVRGELKTLYTFKHPLYGYGAMHQHGFKY